VSDDPGVQRELGQLAQQLADLKETHGRELGEIKDGNAQFLREERSEHKLINEELKAVRLELRELKTALEVHTTAARITRRLLAVVSGVIGTAAGAALVKLFLGK
jgi:hypothetical protein